MKFESNKKLNIVVAGYIVGGPLGGLVWHHLQYILGLHLMGHHVLFVEDSNDYPSCYHPKSYEVTTDPSYGLDFIQKVFTRYGVRDNWAYYNYHTDVWHGKTFSQVRSFADTADIFINLSGVNPLRDIFVNIPIRVLLDTDPVFTQIRHLTEPAAMANALKHTHFFTFGENIGRACCSIPDDGFQWQATRQPVVLNLWSNQGYKKNANWTTVMQWDSYKTREYKGHVFGMKSSSFTDYFSLPQKVDEVFELAVGSTTPPKEKLRQHGWNIINPIEVSLSPADYQQYLRQSKGEWSIAKQGYVASNSGWFSERTTGYLATGRPAVVEDTGFSKIIETGRGLFSFTTPEEVIAAIEEVNSKYEEHCKWAREIAEEYFRYDKVLNGLLHSCKIPVATN